MKINVNRIYCNNFSYLFLKSTNNGKNFYCSISIFLFNTFFYYIISVLLRFFLHRKTDLIHLCYTSILLLKGTAKKILSCFFHYLIIMPIMQICQLFYSDLNFFSCLNFNINLRIILSQRIKIRNPACIHWSF